MTSTQLQRFLARVSQDPELQLRLEARGADPEAIAAAAGFSINASDYSTAQAHWDAWRLSSAYDEDI
jgi:predicted ribosomally synthesized peptide with nif11-like leader